MREKPEQTKKRYGWLLLFTGANWLVVFAMVLFLDPSSIENFLFPKSYLPMLLAISTAIFLSLSILLLSSKAAFRWTLALITFIYLRVWGLGSIVNGFLILGILICLEVYLHTKESVML